MRESGQSFTKRKYSGIEYQVGGDGSSYAAVVGTHLVITGDEKTLKSVIDVKDGKAKSIASIDDFKALRGDLTRDFIAFVYVDTKRVIDETFLGEPALQAALDKAGAKEFFARPIAAALTAGNAGFAGQAAVRSDGAPTEAMKPRESRFAKMAPARTSIFFSTAGIAQTWKNAVSGDDRKEIDKALGKGPFGSLDEALREAGRPLGVDSIEEIINLLTGETALAAWTEDGTTDSAQGVLMAEVADEAKARDVLKKLFAKARTTNETIGGKEVVLARNGEDRAAYVVNGGYMIVGTEGGVRAVLAGGPNLAASAAYQHTAKALPTKLGSYLYLDVHALLLSDAGAIPVPLDAATENLEGFIINGVEDGGLARMSAVVSVKE